MSVRIHAPTIEHVRELLAAERAALPVDSNDRVVRGAAAVADDIIASIDTCLARLLVPTCVACAAKGDSA